MTVRNGRTSWLTCMILMLVLLVPACSQADPDILDPPAAWELLSSRRGDRDFVVIDVRTPEEFRAGHIAGARLIDYHGLDFRDRMAALDRNATVFLYCRSGNRSSRTLDWMRGMGFARVFDLGGGIIEWTKAGLPLVTAE